jgi:hypothetical protein
MDKEQEMKDRPKGMSAWTFNQREIQIIKHKLA